VKWIAICSIVGLVPTAVWMARSQHRTATVEPSAAGVTTAAAGAPAPVRDLDVPAAANAEVPAAVAPAPESKPAAPSQGAQAPTLSDEVAALQAARAALAERDASGAITALDHYKSRFPSGRLAQEATVLRIEALMQRGDHAAASTLADRFEASHPHSPYADRIRSIIAARNSTALERAAKDPGSR
jgi:TolA-binding protein